MKEQECALSQVSTAVRQQGVHNLFYDHNYSFLLSMMLVSVLAIILIPYLSTMTE